MESYKFLQQAEQYAMDRGDEKEFRHWYTQYRGWHNIEDSTWHALALLYNDTVADTLKGLDDLTDHSEQV